MLNMSRTLRLDSELLLWTALYAFAKAKYSLGWNSRLRKDIQGSNTRSSKFAMIGKKRAFAIIPTLFKIFFEAKSICGFQERCWSMRIPKNFVSVTCLITVFSRVRGTLTLTFFCLGWKIIKFVLVKSRDNLFSLSQTIIFASSLLTIETRWLASLWEQKILVSSANSKDWVRQIINVNNKQKRSKYV